MPTHDANFTPSESLALELDRADPLRAFRDEFHIPSARDIASVTTNHDATSKRREPNHSPALGTRSAPASDAPCVYLVGNSLGLQPRATRDALNQELDDWARLGVEAHFHAKHPWFPYHEEVRNSLAHCVGALPREVVAMNTLTTNLHLLMVSFYRPTRERFKLVVEDTCFPSDSYAVRTQVDFHARHAGFNPRAGVIRLKARDGETTLRTDDILATIDRESSSIALVMLGGVNYLTGQLFDIRAITAFARERGIAVGWDLAHAAGNIDLALHDHGPDFAAWCSYKYLNSGPGSIAGAFVHERHLGTPSPREGAGRRLSAAALSSPSATPSRGTGVPPVPTPSTSSLPRFAGWWGNDPATRFKMSPEFVPSDSADAWALSNPSVFATAPLRASLELYERATMSALRAKSRSLTAYLETHLDAINADASARGVKPVIEILTPREASARGCQLSLVVHPTDSRAPRDVHAALLAAGVVTDFREPNVIRAAPVPLYNSFHDVWRFARELRAQLLRA